MKKRKTINFLVAILLIIALIMPSNLSVSIVQAATHSHTGDCYKDATLHTCTGSVSSGGGCYGTKNYHNHSSSCPTHSHTGSSASGGGCYGTKNYHEHSSACPTHSHTGSNASSGGCYTTPVYHSHTDSCYSSSQKYYEEGIIYAESNSGYTDFTTIYGFKCPECGTKDGLNYVYSYSNTGGTVVTRAYSRGKEIFVSFENNNNFNNLFLLLRDNKGNAKTLKWYEDALSQYLSYNQSDTSKFYCSSSSCTTPSTQLLICGKTTSTIDSYSLSCGKAQGDYTCGKTTSTIDSYSLNCGKTQGDYLCGKTTSTIESYSKSCGKQSGNYYTSSGVLATSLCNKIVTDISPNVIHIPYDESVTKGTAKATYLDGHTETVEVKVDDELGKASYTGLIKNGNTGSGTLTASVTINKIPIQSFTLNNKMQILYKGQTPDLSGVANYGEGGRKESLEEQTTSNFDRNLLHTIQDITVSVENGAVVTDTMKVLVLPKPVSLQAMDIETLEGEDKKVTFSVFYEDDTFKELSFMLSDMTKTYVEEYEIGTISNDFSITWLNNNTQENGLDYKTSGEYTLVLDYEGIRKEIQVKSYGICKNNENHENFCHELCPSCTYILNNQTVFDNVISKLLETKNLIQSNINSISEKEIPTQEDIINRDKERFEVLNQNFETYYSNLVELEKQIDEKIVEFNKDWNLASNETELGEVLVELEQYQEESRKNATETYNIVNDTLTSINQLKEQKNIINSFIPEIMILGELNKIYDKTPIKFEIEVTKADFDERFNNPVNYFIYDETNWKQLTEKELEQLVEVGDYTIKVVTQDTDYPIVEKEFVLSIKPKELFISYSNQTKIYDGTDKALLELKVDGVLDKDDVKAEPLSGMYIQSNVGIDLEIIPTEDIVLVGEDAKNYFVTPIKFTGVITKAALTISTQYIEALYGEIPKQFYYTFDGLVGNETPDTIMESIILETNVLSTKAGKQCVDVLCEVINPINYTIKTVSGEILFTVPKGYQKIEMDCLPTSDARIVIVDGVEKELDLPYEIWHPTDRDIIVEKDGYQYNIAPDGLVSLIVKANGEHIAVSEHTVWIDEVEISNVPNIIFSGNGTLSIEDYTGIIELENFNSSQDVVISNGSKVDFIIEGNVTGNGNLLIDENSSVSISGDGKFTLTENIIVDKTSSITINGLGSIIANGIGGTKEKPSGSIIINGGNICAEFIGNHPDYLLQKEEKLPDIVIKDGELEVNEWIGNLLDGNGKEIVKIEIPYDKVPKKEITYTRDNNKESEKWYKAVFNDKKIVAIVNKDTNKFYVNIDNVLYYVDLTKANITLSLVNLPSEDDLSGTGSSSDGESTQGTGSSSGGGSTQGTGSSSSGGSTSGAGGSSSGGNASGTGSSSNNGNSSSTGSTSNEGGFSSTENSSSIENMDISKIQQILDEIFVNENAVILNQDGKVYINTDTLTLKDGYLISENGKDYSDTISYKQCETISSYRIWIKNTNSFVEQTIYLGDIIVDYKKPTTKLKCSTSKIKLSEDEKVKYSYYTNKKIKFKLYDFDFGISGKNKIEYQIVKKGKKLKENKWKIVEGNYFYVKPSGYMQVFIRLTNQAGTQTIVKTTGFKSDKTAPKLKQVGWIIQGIDTNSGIKKVVVNGKKVKNKYRFTKTGTYKVIVYDKAGNKTTKKIKIKKDKEKPVIQFKNNKITVVDNQSGIKKVTVNGKKISTTKQLKKKGSYKIVAYDKAGNKATKKVVIKETK